MVVKRVLVVDDEKSVRFLIEKTLQKSGFEIVTAENGQEGVEKALDLHPDVILMDLFMPVKDGMTAIREIRQDSWGRDAKIIVLTNIDYPESVKETRDLNIENYMVKSGQSLKDIATQVKSITD